MPYLVKDWAAVWLPNRWLIAARGYFGPQNSHRPLMATSVNMYCTEQVGFQHWTQCILIRTKIGCRHQFPITVQCIPGLAIETEILPYRWHHMGQPRPGTKAASWRPPPGQAQTMLGILHPSSFMPGMSTSKDAVVQEPIGGAGGSGDRMWPLHRVCNPRETPNTEHKLSHHRTHWCGRCIDFCLKIRLNYLYVLKETRLVWICFIIIVLWII